MVHDIPGLYKQLPCRRKHVTHTRPGLPNPLEIWGRTDIPLGSGPGKGVVNDGSVWVTEPNEYLFLWKDGETITPKRGLGRLSRVLTSTDHGPPEMVGMVVRLYIHTSRVDNHHSKTGLWALGNPGGA